MRVFSFKLLISVIISWLILVLKLVCCGWIKMKKGKKFGVLFCWNWNGIKFFFFCLIGCWFILLIKIVCFGRRYWKNCKWCVWNFWCCFKVMMRFLFRMFMLIVCMFIKIWFGVKSFGVCIFWKKGILFWNWIGLMNWKKRFSFLNDFYKFLVYFVFVEFC